jgi:hypothetical protein
MRTRSRPKLIEVARTSSQFGRVQKDKKKRKQI